MSQNLVWVITPANQYLLEILGALCDEVQSLKQTVADHDASSAQMRDDITDLQDKNDPIEQYERRNCLHIAGVSNPEYNTAAMVQLVNEVLKVQPLLDKQDINNSHHLPKRRNSPNDQPCPIIKWFTWTPHRDHVLNTETPQSFDHRQTNDDLHQRRLDNSKSKIVFSWMIITYR